MFELKPYSRKNNALYNPFQAVDEFWNDPLGFFGSASPDIFKTDVKDEGDHYLLEADLPGFEKKDIHLELNGDVLTVTAERHSKLEDKDKKDKVVRIERSYGSYSRQFDVSGIDTAAIKAKYDNGVLKLTLPKQQTVLPEAKRLEIE